MHYEAFESCDGSGEWRAEVFDEEGGCFVVIFSGPQARQRAQEYAAWVNAASPDPAR